MPHRITHGDMLIAVLGGPVVRVMDLSADGKVLAVLVGSLAAITGDFAVLLVGVLLASACVDWVFGRAAAWKRGEFSVTISAWKLQSKIAGIMLVLIIRLLEVVLTRAGVPDPNGALAVAVAVGLIYQDLDSIDRHRQTLGGRPIPILTSALKTGRKLADVILPSEPESKDGPRD